MKKREIAIIVLFLIGGTLSVFCLAGTLQRTQLLPSTLSLHPSDEITDPHTKEQFTKVKQWADRLQQMLDETFRKVSLAQFWTSVSGDDIYRVDGKVGIGTTTPDDTFQVVGTAGFGDDSSNETLFASDGVQTMVGTARVWKDVELKPFSVRRPGSNAPAEDEIDNFGFHRFDRGTEESVFYVWVVPEDFATGDGSVKGHFTFVVENPPSGSGDENVRMGFEYKKISDGGVFSFSSGTASGTVDETITDGETALILHISSDGTCTTTGWAAHDHILFRFYRDATAGSDTYDNEGVAANNDVWVKTYHLQYLIDKLGEAA